jgi:hypothetical protein
MRLGHLQWALVAALALACHALPAHAAAGTVTNVNVRVELVGDSGNGGGIGLQTMGQLEEALSETVRAALLDQLDGDLDYISNRQGAVAAILGDVINSTLSKRGFVLEELVLEPGATTQVRLKLRLASERVEDFQVSFSLPGSPPALASVVEEDQETVSAALYSTLARTPVGDVRWLGGLVSETVEARLAGLPEYADFEHQITVTAGPSTQVVVVFTPKANVLALTGAQLTLRSLTLLNTGLRPVREQLAHNLHGLEGLPQSFISAKLPQLQQALFQLLVNHPRLAAHCPDARLELELRGCELYAAAEVDSQRYLTALDTRVALWDYASRDLEARVSGRAGLQFGAGWLALASADLYPGEGEIYPTLGAGHLFGHRGLLALGWDFKAEQLRASAEAHASPQLYFSGEALLGDGYEELGEIALHYRIQDVYELQLGSNLDGEVFAALAAEF